MIILNVSVFLPEVTRRRESLALSFSRDRGNVHEETLRPACGFVFEIIGEIYRGRSNCGVITER